MLCLFFLFIINFCCLFFAVLYYIVYALLLFISSCLFYYRSSINGNKKDCKEEIKKYYIVNNSCVRISIVPIAIINYILQFFSFILYYFACTVCLHIVYGQSFSFFQILFADSIYNIVLHSVFSNKFVSHHIFIASQLFFSSSPYIPTHTYSIGILFLFDFPYRLFVEVKKIFVPMNIYDKTQNLSLAVSQQQQQNQK